jgi:hypothetical protein
MRVRYRLNKPGPCMKGNLLILACMQLVLMTAALIDLRRRPSAEIRGSKPWWFLASFIDIFGPLAYFAFGRKDLSRRKDFL